MFGSGKIELKCPLSQGCRFGAMAPILAPKDDLMAPGT